MDQRPKLHVWTLYLDARLPRLPFPLADRDPDVVVDLGEVVASVYERGGYDARIDYSQPVPPPALTNKDTDYIEQLLSARK